MSFAKSAAWAAVVTILWASCSAAGPVVTNGETKLPQVHVLSSKPRTAPPVAAAPSPAHPANTVKRDPYSSAVPHLGLRYDGPSDGRVVLGPAGRVVGVDPDPAIRLYLHRDGGGANGAPQGGGP
jgi:hypothetical protein